MNSKEIAREIAYKGGANTTAEQFVTEQVSCDNPNCKRLNLCAACSTIVSDLRDRDRCVSESNAAAIDAAVAQAKRDTLEDCAAWMDHHWPNSNFERDDKVTFGDALRRDGPGRIGVIHPTHTELAVRAAVAAERERCAKVLEALAAPSFMEDGTYAEVRSGISWAKRYGAAAIRSATPDEAPPAAGRTERYIVKWNGVGYAAHDTVIDWNISVHRTPDEAEAACAVLNAKEPR